MVKINGQIAGIKAVCPYFGIIEMHHNVYSDSCLILCHNLPGHIGVEELIFENNIKL